MKLYQVANQALNKAKEICEAHPETVFWIGYGLLCGVVWTAGYRSGKKGNRLPFLTGRFWGVLYRMGHHIGSR